MPKRPLDLAVVLLLVLGSALLVAFHVDGYTKLSPIDEMQHIDYLDRVPESPAYGDKVGQEAMRSQACRTVDTTGFTSPPCGLKTYDAEVFQERGYNTAAINPPGYYLLTRAAAETIERVTPADDLVAAGRLAGAVWLGLGLVVTYAVARRRGASVAAAGGVCGLLLATPAMVFANSTINPDSMGFLWGAVLLALLGWWERRPTARRGAALVAVAGLSATVKFTFVMAPAAIALYVVLRLLSESRAAAARDAEPAGDPVRPSSEESARVDGPADANRRPVPVGIRAGLLTAVAVVGLPLLVAFTWLRVQATRLQQDPDDPPTMALAFHVDAFPWLSLYDNALVFLTPLSSPWVNVGTPQLTNIVTSISTLVLLGGAIAAALFGVGSRSEQLLARAALTTAIVFSVGLVVLNYVQMHSYFPLPNRYAGTLVPIFAVVTATGLRSRTGRVVVVLLAASALAVTAWRLIGLA